MPTCFAAANADAGTILPNREAPVSAGLASGLRGCDGEELASVGLSKGV